MQIHELNNYSGSIGSGSFLAMDDGNDTGKVSADQLLAGTVEEINDLEASLNARIDNIIAGGTAPSEAEIIDARLGSADLGSVPYASLGDAIRGQASFLDNLIEIMQDGLSTWSILFPVINGTQHTSDKIVDVNIRAGETFYIVTKYTPDNVSRIAPKFYYGDSTSEGQQNITVNQKYEYKATKDIVGLGFYGAGNLPTGEVLVLIYTENSAVGAIDDFNMITRRDYYRVYDVDQAAFMTLASGMVGDTSGGNTKVNLNPLSATPAYKSYWFILNQDSKVYIDPKFMADYTSIVFGFGASGVWNDAGSSKRMDCTSSVRYRNTDNNLPTSADNAISCSKGDVIVVTVRGGDAYLAMDGEVSLVNDPDIYELREEIERSKNLVRFVPNPQSGITKKLDVLLSTAKGYTGYVLARYDISATNAKNWRIKEIDLYNENGELEYPLTDAGEIELAVKLTGRPDFAGGSLHGDEVEVEHHLFIDGKETDESTLPGYVPFRELKFTQVSNLYDPNDGTTLIATHGKEYLFTGEKLILSQYVIWAGAFPLSECYMSMLTPLKLGGGSGTTKITKDYYSDMDYSLTEIPATPNITIADAKSVTMSSDESELTFDISLEQYPTGLDGGDEALIRDNGGQNYNKIYFPVCTSGSSTNGERWASKTVIQII